jgi:FdhD protein
VPHLTARRQAVHADPSGFRGRAEVVAVEEPLEIRVAGAPVSVTMRTPGHDLDLVTGWLVSEGSARRPGDVLTLRHCAPQGGVGDARYNTVDVELAPQVIGPRPRAQLTTGSCGVCGSDTVQDVIAALGVDVSTDPLQMPVPALTALPARLLAAQRAFRATGGLHAAALFDADGTLLCAREDIGRHNAVDKVIGWAYRDGRLPLRGHVMQVSGRASFELVHKVVVAGIPMLCAVSAPSSLAVDLAQATGLTLVGFMRGESMNVYSGSHRLLGNAAADAADAEGTTGIQASGPAGDHPAASR